MFFYIFNLVITLFFIFKLSIINYEVLFKGGDYRFVLKVVLIIFAFFQSFSFKIIDIFTPVHVGFLNVISSLFQTIQFSIVTTELEHLILLILDILCLIIIGFGTLVFT